MFHRAFKVECSPQIPFLQNSFYFLTTHMQYFPYSCMQRKGHPTVDPKSECHKGVYDFGAFKLDHLQSLKTKIAK